MASTFETNLATRPAILRIPIRGVQCSFGPYPGACEKEAFSENEAGLFRNWDRVPELPSDFGRKNEPHGDVDSGADSNSDPFDGSSAHPTVYPSCIENECCKTAFHLGQAAKVRELFDKYPAGTM